MSYDADLLDAVTNQVIELEFAHQLRGGTYALGGSKLASLNITYNYSDHFYRVINPEMGIRVLYGKTGAESIPLLKSAIAQLGDDISDDYWEATEGNAKQALCGLLVFAQLRPDGLWSGD